MDKNFSNYTLDFNYSSKSRTEDGIKVIKDESDEEEIFLLKCCQPRIDDPWYKLYKKLSDSQIDYQYKKNAVRYWRSCKSLRTRKVSVVKNAFKLVTTEGQLRRWEKEIVKSKRCLEKMDKISEITFKKFLNALDKKQFPIRDQDLRRWALAAQNIIGFYFTVEESWIKEFQESYGIVKKFIDIQDQQ
ncbi:uncharacterized protein LOC123266553 [Cotesia glomerata]|uniref:HTH CENPB-type domain-containing protein n=1 Tax=Cotesia glomerata TaxID=32391 RepID=A0AAV7HXA2_COTGL|nr:uncharacterized protein LOC123266553 [Cotesia glomerata]XP_044586790.1 uncharacterized protein LOC123266553 [Cotesia glomerata]XP_044586791.1 uncharacterized protein LOC123266553 [Cotesia glomerata]KAH0535823.1 hypothetical protein KQX54_019550 [Cotesia glomerata]